MHDCLWTQPVTAYMSWHASCAACRSAGKQVDWDGNNYTVEELTEGSFGDVDIALFSAGGSISKKFAPIASDAGCTVRQAPACTRLFLLSPRKP